jgi:hypothetical protein
MSTLLTQSDQNILEDSKQNTQDQNQSIQQSSVTITTEIASLLLVDVPFKKQLDPIHVNIFAFEEELRRLNGTSIIQPLQEKGFTISDTSSNFARLYINNGRLIITENTILPVSVVLTIDVGLKILNVGPSLSLSVGQFIVIAYDFYNQMQGEIVAYNSSTGSLSVNVITITGSGTYSTWSIYTQIFNGPLFPMRGYSRSRFAGTQQTGTITNLSTTISGLTSTAKLRSTGIIKTAGSFVIGANYIIVFIGSTDFTLIGASSNAVGVTFTATGVGSGTGTATTNPGQFVSGTGIPKNAFIMSIASSTSIIISQPCTTSGSITITFGSDFDIWSRDRYGATTSSKQTGSPYIIDKYHKKLKVTFDGVTTVEIDLSNLISIDQVDEVVISNTLGTETAVQLKYFPVISSTDSISLSLSSFVLIDKAQYMVDYNTGIITFLQAIRSGFKMTADYENLDGTYSETVFENTTGAETVAQLTHIPMFGSIVTLTTTFITINLVRGTDYNIDYSTGYVTLLTPIVDNVQMLASYENSANVLPSSLASSIQLLIQNSDPSLEKIACVFNISINTFTIISGSGPSASVQVVPCSDLIVGEIDLMNYLGFDQQFMIQGKYQNNLLNVAIDATLAGNFVVDAKYTIVSIGTTDFTSIGASSNTVGLIFTATGMGSGTGVAATSSQISEIKISDFRRCFQDANLGYDNDDLGYDWSGGLDKPLGYIGANKVGPLFCSGISNGKDVAKSIEAQLRMVGSGGFINAKVSYFTRDNIFIIYSGTMGPNSSVHVIPASDSDRDAMNLVGYVFPPVFPEEERGNEQYYNTLRDLYDKLATVSHIQVSGLNNPSTLSHSILYQQLNGVNISSSFNDNVDLTTTLIYDYGSRGLPRLYPNGKLVIDSSNNMINFFETTDIELAVTIASGTYTSEHDVATVIQSALGSGYTCTYSSQQKKFTIAKNTGSFGLLFQTGANALTGIGNYIGFNTSDKTLATSFTSDFQVTFQMTDYFNPFLPNQFDGAPKAPDYTVDEYSALLYEQLILGLESPILVALQNELTLNNNEVLLDGWESIANIEFFKTQQEDTALRYQKGAYVSHISENDSVTTNIDTALANLTPNFNNLTSLETHILLHSHAAILNLTQYLQSFSVSPVTIVAGAGSKIYNNPPILVSYENVLKQITGRWNLPYLFCSSTTFTPDIVISTLTNNRDGVEGYSYSGQTPSGSFFITDDTNAVVTGTTTGPFDLSVSNTLLFEIDGGGAQTAEATATAGYTQSRSAATSGFVIKANTNDWIDFKEAITELHAQISPGVYDVASLTTEIQNKMNAAGTYIYSVSYAANTFAITTTSIFQLLFLTGVHNSTSIAYTMGYSILDHSGSLVYIAEGFSIFPVITGVNDTFITSINGSSSSIVTISQGRYNSSGLIIEMTNKIGLQIPVGQFNITYSSDLFVITSTIRGTVSVVEVYEGTNDFLRTIKLDADVPVHGTGNVANVATVSVDEFVSILSVLSGFTVSNSSNHIKMQTNSILGSLSSIEFTGGSAIAILGFVVGTTTGIDANNRLKVDIDGDLSKPDIILTTGTLTGSQIASDIQTKLQVIGSGGYAASICTWNETTVWASFTNAFRIVSGTRGISSTVNVSSGSAIPVLKFDTQTIVNGQIVVDIQATLDSTSFKSVLSLGNSTTRMDLNFNIAVAPYNKVVNLVDAINTSPFYSDATLTKANLISRIAEPYRIENVDTLIVTANGEAPQTLTFHAVHGTSVSGSGGHTRIYSSNNRIGISLNGYTRIEITIGAQLSAYDIAINIQLQVRSIIVPNDSELQAAYSQFTCSYVGTRYYLTSGTGGTGSSVVITDALSNNAAVDLKLGVMNGGYEDPGSGNFVNSSFVTKSELESIIYGSGFECDLTSDDYLKIQSSTTDDTSRIQIAGTAKSKLGFDLNDDSYPSSDFSNLDTSQLMQFADQSIMSPIMYKVRIGFLSGLGSINVTYYTTDNSQITARLPIISSRLPTIPARLAQITARANTIVSALTPTLYNSRKSPVTVRSNKKTGSYVQVGNKLNQQDNNQSAISTNNGLISTINSML